MSYSFVSGATYDYDAYGCYYYYVYGEGSEGSEIGFKDIVDYFESNPIRTPFLYPDHGDLCENNSADWTCDDAVLTDESTITQVGSYSLKATIDNSVANTYIKWNPPSGKKYMGCGSAQELRFWMRSNVTTVTLDTVKLYSYYNASNPEYYEALYDVRESSSTSWKQVIIDLHDYTDIDYRFYWHRISRIDFNLSGVTVGDEIYLDGVHFYLEDANPKDLGGGVYNFPLSSFLYSCCFKDKEFNYIGGYHSGVNITSYYGAFTCGALENTYVAGGFFFRDAICSRDAGVFFNYRGNASGDYLKFYNCHFTGSSSQCVGISSYTNTNDSFIELHNCSFHNALDGINGVGKINLDRVTIGCCRYPLWMGGSTSTINDLKIINDGRISSSWLWLMDAQTTTVKGLTLSEYNGTNRFLYGRNYNNQIYDTVQYLYDVTLLDDCDKTISARYDVYQYVKPGLGVYQNVGYTLNITVLDENSNAISGASVILTDKDSNIVVNASTDADGKIEDEEFTVVSKTVISNGINRFAGDWYPFKYQLGQDTGADLHAPFILTISKSGYRTYRLADFYPSEPINWTIKLSDAEGGTKIYDSTIYDSTIY